MTTITEVAQFMQVILTEKANELGRSSGFIRRERKLSGASFAQAVVFGWMGAPEASSGTLSQSAANVGVVITRQGLAQRFSEQAGAFLLALLQAALGYVLGAPMQSLALLERFNGVYVLDSTRIQLPAALGGKWSGGLENIARVGVTEWTLVASAFPCGGGA